MHCTHHSSRHSWPFGHFSQICASWENVSLPSVVFFTLKDSSDAAIQTLLDACHKYLKDHPGVVYFGAGTLAKEYARPVNDHAFHVCLNVVFDSRASHDIYQTAPDHLKFIADHKESWEKVRVFDADVT